MHAELFGSYGFGGIHLSVGDVDQTEFVFQSHKLTGWTCSWGFTILRWIRRSVLVKWLQVSVTRLHTLGRHTPWLWPFCVSEGIPHYINRKISFLESALPIKFLMITSHRGLADFISISVIVNLSSLTGKKTAFTRVKSSEVLFALALDLLVKLWTSSLWQHKWKEKCMKARYAW